VPIRASFDADFRSFISAADSASHKLQEFETDAAKVQKSLDRIGESFSGKKIISEAELMTRAIGDVTEVTKLTQKEQARVNATLTEAIAKYRALGQEAPADMIKIADATKQVPKELNAAGDAAKALSGALAGMFSVQALIGFGKELLDTADQIMKVSDQTGLLTDEVQKLQYIGSQSGNGIEELTGAVGAMQNRLASGDDSAIAALSRLGLSFDDLKTKDPYEQLTAISSAFQNVKNPATQAQIAMDLFGKAGIGILPTLKSDMKAVGEEAPIMSENTVRALDSAGDSLAKFGMQIKVWAAESYNYFSGLFDKMIASVARWAAMTIDELGMVMGWLAKMPGADKIFPGLKDAIKGVGETAQWFRDVASGMEHPIDNVGKAAKGAIPPLEQFKGKTKEHKEAQDEAAKAAQAHAEKILGLADAMRGLDAVRAATDALEALHLAQAGGFSISNMTIEQAKKLNATIESAIEVYQSAGQTIPAEWLAVANETTIASIQIMKGLDGITGAVNKLKQTPIVIPLPPIPSLSVSPLTALPGVNVGMPTIPKVDLFSQLFGDPKDFGSKLTTTIAGAFQSGGAGGAVSAAAGLMGSSIGGSVAGKLSASLLKEGSGLFSKALGGVISSALPLVGGMIAPLAGALWNHLFGTAGRDKVKDFAASFGGFDELHVKLNALGAEGEQLWIKLTQGTGRNNPEQAAANIKAIEDALDGLKNKQTETAASAQAAADASQAILDAQQAIIDLNYQGADTAAMGTEQWIKYQDAVLAYHEAIGKAAVASGDLTQEAYDRAFTTIRSLDGQIKGLAQSIADEAPEEVIGNIEKETRAQIDAISKQRDAAQQAIDDTTNHSAQAAEEAANTIDDALQKREYHIKVKVDLDGLPGGSGSGGGSSTGYGATGAIPFGAGVGGSAGTTQHFTIQIGEDTIGRAAVRGMPRQFTLQGL
jgi:hypothetical protein